ncbi:uncharacterized protein GGS22DRAFT_122055 [Annulohypoxylon maeteangense]|uniref:uncharacterized protein n=1 Tax=Annulohypoxylon maeteangense TaxID=1927788 RepID=UPI0020078AF3|nr:uncharacterized protein GGS22DRAFT_122055 [Annulohypoxylon maeteangense]KAI0885965.1 hypothetical protein GGS22DRAFT_122055 [Annulohypoxylon maeteangense]
MGAVVSCVQSIFRTIGNVIMAIVAGVGNILQAIISGIVTFFGIIVSFLTCGYCSSGRRHRSTGGGMGSTTGTRRGWGRRRHVTTTSRI